MYSLILMSALATAPDTAEFNGFFHRLFHRHDAETESASASNGCHGSTSQSTGCSGGGCSGSCHGSSSSSSSSTGFGHRLRAFGHGHKGSSCYGSGSSKSNGCYGTSAKTGCCGGSGSGYGCTGSTYAHSCNGGAMAPMWSSPPPFNDGFASPSPAVSYTGPVYPSGGGCFGSGIPLGSSVPTPMYDGGSVSPPPMMAPTPPLPTSPSIPPAFDGPPATPRPAAPPTVEETRSSPASRISDSNSGRATVVVRLPADARLYAEGRRLNLTSAERTFVTPVLPSTEQYVYVFRAEYERNGETISQSKRIPIMAGRTVTVDFADLTVSQRTNPTPKSNVVAQAMSMTPKTLPTIPPVIGTASTVKTPVPVPAQPTNAERARITVKLPPGVKLYVDNTLNTLNDAVRDFSTPPLPMGQEYAYTMRAERVRNGQPEIQTQKVSFRAGELVTVDFTDWPQR